MKSSENIKDDTSAQIINAIFEKLKLQEVRENFKNILSILEKDRSFQAFLAPGYSYERPSSKNLTKLHQYFDCKIIEECHEWAHAYDTHSITLEEFISNINNTLKKYNDMYNEYNGYLVKRQEEILEPEYEYDNLNYITTERMVGTGKYQEVTEVVHLGGDIYNTAIKDIKNMQQLLSSQAELIDLIQQQIEIYKSQVKQRNDLHDQKIYVLQEALKAVIGDFVGFARDKKYGKSTSKALLDAIALYPDALKGKETKNIIDKVINYTNNFLSLRDIAKYTPSSLQVRERLTSIKEGMNIQSVAFDLTRVSSMIDPMQIVYTQSIDMSDGNNSSKYEMDENSMLLVSKKERGYLDLKEKLIHQEKKYLNKKDELHIQKMNVIKALQQFLDAPISHTALQHLMLIIKDNPRCFEGSRSEVLDLFNTVFNYMGVSQVGTVPWIKEEQKNAELDRLMKQIDSYQEEVTNKSLSLTSKIEEMISDIKNNNEKIMDRIQSTKILLNEYKEVNTNNEKDELKSVSMDFPENGNTSYKLGNKIIQYHSEVDKQIEEMKVHVEGLSNLDKLMHKFDQAIKYIRGSTEKLIFVMQELKNKYALRENNDLDVNTLLSIKKETGSLSHLLEDVLIKYEKLIQTVSQEYGRVMTFDTNLSELRNKAMTSAYSTSDDVELVLQQAKNREQQELEEKYKKIDEKYEEMKQYHDEIFKKRYEVNTNVQYDVRQVLEEAKTEIEIANDYFNMVFGGLSGMSKEDDSEIQKELEQILIEQKEVNKKEENMSEEEFNRTMESLPKVSNIGQTLFGKSGKETKNTNTTEQKQQDKQSSKFGMRKKLTEQ